MVKKQLYHLGLILGLILTSTVTAGAVTIKKDGMFPLPSKMKPNHSEISNTGQSSQNISTRALTDIITNPVGEEKLYSKTCAGTFQFMEDAFYYEDTVSSKIIWGEDNKVYFYDILSLAEYETYVVGTVEGNKITIDLPQTVYYDADENYYVELQVLEAFDYRNEFNFPVVDYVPCGINSITFTLADNGVITMDLPGGYDYINLPDYALGYIYSDTQQWFGFTDFAQVYSPVEGNINQVPENVEMRNYAFIYDGHGIFVEAGYDTQNLYIRGLNPNFPDGVIIGEIDNDIVTIKQNQIMGMYMETLMYLKLVYPNPDYDIEDDYSWEYLFAPEDAVFKMQISNDGNTISSLDNQYLLCLNGSPTRLYYLAAYDNIKLNYQTSFEGDPKNPADPWWYDEFAMGGTGLFFFWVYDVSTDNTLLDVGSLYYRIYRNGELMTFVQQDAPAGSRYKYRYPQVLEPTTMIPYMFMNWQDIYLYADTARRMVEIYDPNVETMGVQLVYDYEGVVKESEILQYNVKTLSQEYLPAGIGSIKADNETIRGIYNLQGVKIAEDSDPTSVNSLSPGVYIINGKKMVIK